MIGAFVSLVLFATLALASAVNPEWELNTPIDALGEKLTKSSK